MIELLIIVGLAAALGWLAWKGKLKPICNLFCKKQTAPSQQATSSAANTRSQTTVASPSAPIAQQPEPVTAPHPTAEPVAEPPVPQASNTTPLAVKETTAGKIPEDSILKRHYLAALQAEKDALSNPYPTDSVLRRHYEAMHKIAVPQRTETVDQTTAEQPQVNNPEDSTLQKPNLDQLRSEIAAELPTPPTDSVLKRHYESLLQAKLQQRLAGQ